MVSYLFVGYLVTLWWGTSGGTWAGQITHGSGPIMTQGLQAQVFSPHGEDY